jgi:superfamily II DNA or RNA helicase
MSFQTGDLVRLKESNPLECVMGIVERVGMHQTRVNFMRLPWTPPDVALPEMRDFPHDQLVRCPDPWTDAAQGEWTAMESCRLRVRAAELWLSNGQGQLGNARTDLLPHQVCLVHEVVERKRRRLLIAEEVGMGKTIETGMIIHALMQRRELERCLVVCPAGQIRQWQEELEDKLKVRFEIYRHDVDGRRAFSFPMVIASLDTLKLDDPNQRLRGKSHREILLDAPNWDLVVFDEAHRLSAKDYGSKTEKTLNFKLAEELCGRTRDFIFLTGTPHDGTDSKFRHLLKVLEPEVVFSRQETGNFFGNIILKNRKSEARDADGELLFKKVSVEKLWIPPKQTGEAQFHAALTEYLLQGYGVAGQDPNNPRSRALGFVMTTFQKLASSSIAAVRTSLAKRLKLLEKGGKPAPEKTGNEKDERFEGEAEEATADEIQAKELREAFTQLETNMLRKLVEFDVPEEAKWGELCRLVDQVSAADPNEKFLIFTEYRGTIAFLKAGLEAEHGEGSVGVIMGGMGTDGRREVIRVFKEDATCRFMLSTEAGGEGINLQFCNLVVNYDLPWNPFRVVQRIGRVHRIGQRRNMQIFNYKLRNELDQRLSECHEARVGASAHRLAEVTGQDAADIQEQLIGFAQEFIDYDKMYRKALQESSTRSSEAEIAEGIRKAEEAFKIAYETVFKHAVSPFNPERFKKIIGQNLTLEDLRDWLDGYLKAQGRRLMHRPTEDLYEFLVPDSLKHHLPAEQRTVKGTFERQRAIKDSSIALLAFGHPAIDLLLRAALAPDSFGYATAIQLAENCDEAKVVASVLLRQAEHSGASAFRLLTVVCRLDGSCSFADETGVTTAKQKNSRAGGLASAAAVRTAMVEFLSQQFPSIDFLGEKLCWIAAFTFGAAEKDET